MIVKSIKLKNYRNYESLHFTFDDKINILYGDNAQGKTNILEALYLLGTTKSHRKTKDRDLIQFGCEESHVEIVVLKNDTEYVIDMHLKKNSPKGIAINKVPIRRAGELFGMIYFVFFSPEDLNIIKDAPSARRRFMDLELSQLDKVYLSNLSNYNRIINQRNHLLKDINIQNNISKKNLLETLDIWDMQLVEYGNRIIKEREKFISELNKIIFEIHKKLTNGREEISIVYEKDIGNYSLEEILKRNRKRDIRMKSTSSGPHRDDLHFKIGEMDVRQFGSQGQQRTAALSLKLSEIKLVKELTGNTPVLLLDDVLSELDKHRQNYLLESIRDTQTMITCTGLDEFVNHRFSMNKIFYVEDGRVTVKN